jgi:hypothetical protein
MERGEEPLAGFLQAVGDRTVFEPPLVVGGDLLVQALGRVCHTT